MPYKTHGVPTTCLGSFMMVLFGGRAPVRFFLNPTCFMAEPVAKA